MILLASSDKEAPRSCVKLSLNLKLLQSFVYHHLHTYLKVNHDRREPKNVQLGSALAEVKRFRLAEGLPHRREAVARDQSGRGAGHHVHRHHGHRDTGSGNFFENCLTSMVCVKVGRVVASDCRDRHFESIQREI